MDRFLTRKEIAGILDIKSETVRRNERKLGLDKCRSSHENPVRYHRHQAEETLRRRNYIAAP